MSSYARVDSIDALKDFKASLSKFAEIVGGGLGEAEAEIQRTMVWLKHEQFGFWKGQIRKRAETLKQAKTALNNKRLYKTPTGGKYSTVEEEKAFRLAKKRYEEAEQKLANVTTWARKLQHEMHLFKEQIRGARQTIEVDVPNAAVQLDKFVTSLEAYVSVPVPSKTPTAHAKEGAGRGVDGPTMVREASSPQDPEADYEALRGRTPDSAIRDETAPVDSAFRFPNGYEISASQREAIRELNKEVTPCDPEDKVVLENECWRRPRVYLERVDAKSPGDSGWFVGSAEDDATPAFTAVKVADLLAIRPDWAELLSLPCGFVVVLDAGSVEAALNEHGEVVWPEGGFER